jgi:hypothetical protein
MPPQGVEQTKVFLRFALPYTGRRTGSRLIEGFMRTVKRVDSCGRDVTDLHGLWDETDLEILCTPYGDPNQTSGQKTNGPALFFVRRLGGPWIYTECNGFYRVQTAIEKLGMVFFEG